MVLSPLFFTLRSPEATARLARRLGALLRAGDCLLLEGPIGAGKTHFARHLIQSLQDAAEDVPSPTFTLVQTYDTVAGELWHADLYRLSAPEEIEELGLTEAMEHAICLIEWPDRLGPLAPPGALHLAFAATENDEDTRSVTVSWTARGWEERLARLETFADA